MKQYCCPDPTSEQIENAKNLGYDAYNRCGHGVTDTSPCDILCAACLIHDELFLIGGSVEVFHLVNANFARDAIILAKAESDVVKQLAGALEALGYIAIVQAAAWQFWNKKDRNTDITRIQGAAFMLDAKKWINECAIRVGRTLPYPEAV